MGSQAEIAEAILERLLPIGPVRIRKMFGEYAVYLDDKMLAAIADNRLLVKRTDAGQSFLGPDAPLAAPYPGAKPHFLIDWEANSQEWLAELVLLTYEALPLPPAKKPKKKKNG